MAEAPSKIKSMRKWVVDHKLRAVGCLWLSGISSSIAYNWSRPNMKTSVKLIHARLHAQALTIAALGSCALVEYYDQNYGSSGPKRDKNRVVGYVSTWSDHTRPETKVHERDSEAQVTKKMKTMRAKRNIIRVCMKIMDMMMKKV
ncbi:hypothetical protein VPH35_023210 [Triticum aestivum]